MAITYSKSKDQPGKVANPARGQLNRENKYIHVPVRAWGLWSHETGWAVQTRSSLVISILRLNRVLTNGISPEFRDGVHLYYCLNRHNNIAPSGQSRVCRVTQLRTDSVQCSRARRYRASKPQGNPKWVLPWQVTIDQLICASISHTQYWYKVGNVESNVAG